MFGDEATGFKLSPALNRDNIVLYFIEFDTNIHYYFFLYHHRKQSAQPINFLNTGIPFHSLVA